MSNSFKQLKQKIGCGDITAVQYTSGVQQKWPQKSKKHFFWTWANTRNDTFGLFKTPSCKNSCSKHSFGIRFKPVVKVTFYCPNSCSKFYNITFDFSTDFSKLKNSEFC